MIPSPIAIAQLIYDIGKTIYKHVKQRIERIGHMRAKTNLGSFYFEGKGNLPQDLTKAACLFEEAAKLGHPRAMQNLSFCYETGQGVPPNPLKASEWKAKASAPQPQLQPQMPNPAMRR